MASQQTTDHQEIKQWVEEHGGQPSVVKDTHNEEGSGILRIDFDYDGNDDDLESISWDEFFTIFDKNHLAFLHSDEQDNNFNKFVQS